MKKTLVSLLIIIIAAVILIFILKQPRREEVVAPQTQVEEGQFVNENTQTPTGKLPAGSKPTAENPRLLTSSVWIWERTVMNDGAVITPKKAGTFTLSFDGKGGMGGKTDCNGFFGSYTLGTDGIISFGPIGSTLMFCEDSQETVFRNAIENSSHYMFDDNGNLILLLKYDSGSVIFKK